MEVVKNVIYNEQFVQINSKIIKELEEVGKEEFIASVGDNPKDRQKGELTFEDVSMEIEEMYYEEGKLEITSTLRAHDKELGFFSFSIPLDRKIVLDIIQAYMKKLGKIKTVLEATKDF